MTVTLIDSMGDDLRIVNAARVSFAKVSSWWHTCNCPDCPGHEALGAECDHGCGHIMLRKNLRVADRGVLRYMMRNHHGTPFEHVVFQFHVSTNIGVAREWMRHRLASYNELSTRYVEMQPNFYIPEGDAVRTQVGKPGHYTFEPLAPTPAQHVYDLMVTAYGKAYDSYQRILAYGGAKELARNVLPLGLMTEFYMTVNARSLFNFLALRTHPSALLEIRNEALAAESLVRLVIPETYDVWLECGRPVGDTWHDCDAMCVYDPQEEIA